MAWQPAPVQRIWLSAHDPDIYLGGYSGGSSVAAFFFYAPQSLVPSLPGVITGIGNPPPGDVGVLLPTQVPHWPVWPATPIHAGTVTLR